MPRFPNLVIETTGLAEPGPVAEALISSDLLKERYRLAGVVTCLSASTADAVLKQHAEARAQLAGADVLVITKTDLVSPENLEQLSMRVQHQLAHLEIANAPSLLSSAQANLSAADLLKALLLRELAKEVTSVQVAKVSELQSMPSASHALHLHQAGVHCDICDHEHASGHAAQALWWPIAPSLALEDLMAQVGELQNSLGAALLRIKGRVQTPQGHFVIQLAPFETQAQVCDDELTWEDSTRSGLTVIVSSHLPWASQELLNKKAISSLGD
jgi:G3E family GTPase